MNLHFYRPTRLCYCKTPLVTKQEMTISVWRKVVSCRWLILADWILEILRERNVWKKSVKLLGNGVSSKSWTMGFQKSFLRDCSLSRWWFSGGLSRRSRRRIFWTYRPRVTGGETHLLLIHGRYLGLKHFIFLFQIYQGWTNMKVWGTSFFICAALETLWNILQCSKRGFYLMLSM